MFIEQRPGLMLLLGHPITWLLSIWDKTLKSQGSVLLPAISLWNGPLCWMEPPRATLRILRYSADVAPRILVLISWGWGVAQFVVCLGSIHRTALPRHGGPCLTPFTL